MGNWYKVTKKIHGRLYDYWQRTQRRGKQVKTFNKYIGPTTSLYGALHGWRHMTAAQRYNARKDQIFHDAKLLNRQYDALREAEKRFPIHPDKPSAIPLREKAQAVLDAAPENISRDETLRYAQKITELSGATEINPSAMLEALQYACDPERKFGKQVHVHALFDKDMVSLANYRRAEMIGVSGLDCELPLLTTALNERIRRLNFGKRETDNLRRYITHQHGDYLTSEKLRQLQIDNSFFFQTKALSTRPNIEITPQPDISPTAPRIPEEAIYQLTPSTAHLTGRDKRDYERERKTARMEDERIQYGPLKARLKRQRQKFLAAKRKTRGVKALNQFLAQALIKK